ncbi:hypothetical protein BSKO_07765 [Bryopsis sp. KO-2023]|nr:hypothetical protein BSKO_07765 [Bryopsis sp. KO-2023]
MGFALIYEDLCEIANNLVIDSPPRLEVLVKYNFLDIMGEYVIREDFSVKKMAVLVLANSAAVASDEVIRDYFANELIIKSFVKVLVSLD